MKFITQTLNNLDAFQQRHRPLAFICAVGKKYHEDRAGYNAALLTYYGFLALFPLLLVLTTLAETAVGNYPEVEEAIVGGLTDYFPLLGNQLSSHVHALKPNSFMLAVGCLFALYGARGVADVLRHGIQNIWGIPVHQREAFWPALGKSIGVVLTVGLGLLGASIIASLAAAAPGWGFRLGSVAINLFILFWLFDFILNASLPVHVKAREIRIGATTAAIGLTLLQAIGGYVLAHELKSLDALYSYFALSLGLLFWIYLQAQIIYYAAEVAVVSSKKLWPRSLLGPQPHD